MNSIHSFISGEGYFAKIVGKNREQYIALVKETLKTIFTSAFMGKKDMFQ